MELILHERDDRERVVGRALRRRSYELNTENLLDMEYADILGIPFDFTAKPVEAEPRPPRQTTIPPSMSEP